MARSLFYSWNENYNRKYNNQKKKRKEAVLPVSQRGTIRTLLHGQITWKWEGLSQSWPMPFRIRSHLETDQQAKVEFCTTWECTEQESRCAEGFLRNSLQIIMGTLVGSPKLSTTNISRNSFIISRRDHFVERKFVCNYFIKELTCQWSWLKIVWDKNLTWGSGRTRNKSMKKYPFR